METTTSNGSARLETSSNIVEQQPPRGATPQRPIAKPKRKPKKTKFPNGSDPSPGDNEEAGPLRDFATGDSKYDSTFECCDLSRVGNFTVLYEQTSSNPEGERILVLLLGPYWDTAMFFTLPVLVASSAFGSSLVTSPSLHVAYWTLTLWVVGWLLATATRDPGIVRYYARPPPGLESTWIYSTQARSYRPPGSFYCRDTNCVIDGFDHTCPWTGTAIGKGNTTAFHVFVYSFYALLGANFALCIHVANPRLSIGIIVSVLGAAFAAVLLACSWSCRGTWGEQQDTSRENYGAVPPSEIQMV